MAIDHMRWGLGRGGLFSPQPCYDPVTLATIATVATVAGTTVSAAGTIAGGNAANKAAGYEALQLEAKGKEEQAAARVEADQYKRKKELAQSTLQNRAAASGFSATDPTSLNLAEGIEEYGTLQEQMALYGGASRRAGLEGQAAASRWEGKVAKQASRYKAAATILGGISTLASRYNPTATQSDVPDPMTGESGSRYRYG
mgnify:CR=1 FL=1